MSFVYFDPSFVPNGTNEEICAEVLRTTPRFQSPGAGYEGFVIAFIVLYQVYWVITMVIYYRLRTKHIELRLQPLWLIVYQGMFAVCLLILGPLRDVTGRENWSCDAYMWARCSISFLSSYAVNLRIYDFYSRLKLHEMLAFAKLDTIHEVREYQTSGATSTSQRAASSLSPEDDVESNNRKEGSSQITSAIGVTPDALRKQMRISSVRFYLQQAMALTIPSFGCIAIIYGLYPYYGKGCTGCLMGPVEFIISSITGTFSIPLTVGVIQYLHKRKASAPFFTEMKYTIAVASLAYPFIGLLSADPWLKLTVTGIISWEWFTFLALNSLHFFPVTLPILRIWRRRFKAVGHERITTTADMLTLMTNREGIKSFMQQLISEYNAEHLRFWEEVHLYRAGFLTFKPSQRVHVARQIYESFIPDTAFLQINISYLQRSTLAKLFDQTDEQLRATISENVFLEAENEVVAMLRDAFTRYQNGPYYEQFMMNHKNKALAVTNQSEH
jgi:hypothetical protein